MAKLTRRKDKNGLVLEKGEGQRKDGRYYYEWSDELGKRHFVYATTLAELRNKEKTVVFDVLTGISQDGANLTLNEAIEYWIKVRQDDVAIGALKPTTLSQYLRTYDNHVRDSLGTLKIKDITKTKLSAFYKRKMADGFWDCPKSPISPNPLTRPSLSQKKSTGHDAAPPMERSRR